MNEWIQVIGGALLLYFGAGWFVVGASALALALGIPELLVGLTVVAYGTSAPEIIVGVQAAAAGYGQVALGNVIGSNIANVGLILGVAALVRPARVDGSLRRRELPVLLATAVAVPAVLADDEVSRLEGGALIVAAFAYTIWMIRAAHAAASIATLRREAQVANDVADAAGAPNARGTARAVCLVIIGLGVLLVGGNLFIEGAVSVARNLGLSERLVGLTIVAIGTSLPELVTSVVAARRGHSDLAVGNVIGSNIFNVLLCLGAAALTQPLVAQFQTLAADVGSLVLMTALIALFIRSERTISRAEGAVVLGLYAVFIVLSVARG